VDGDDRLLSRRQARGAARGGRRGARGVRRRGRGRRRGGEWARNVPRASLRLPLRARRRRARRTRAHRGAVRLDETGELGLLAELERRGLAQGIEHDAAQIDGLVVTQDALVEGVHFRFDLLSWRELGSRAAAVNISDLGASGAEPLALLVTLGAPGETRVEDVVELYEGLREARVPVRGGDTTRADSVVP